MTEPARQFGKVAVLMGGWSAEREISLESGAAVLNALLQAGVNAVGVDLQKGNFHQLEGFDRVFNILHGRGGEDGVIQGVLDFMDIPYTGSGIQASALAMDKIKTKKIWSALGLPTPEFEIMHTAADCARVLESTGLPLIVKPAHEGSSIGISKVTEESELESAFNLANSCASVVFAEKWIEGEEYTVSILNGKALPAIKLCTPNVFYDYEAKYKSDTTEYICPCGLDTKKEKELASLALKAFSAINGKGWGRVDFMMDTDSNPWLIEVNLVPGMTSHSLVPMAAKQSGLDFQQLATEILKTSFEGAYA